MVSIFLRRYLIDSSLKYVSLRIWSWYIAVGVFPLRIISSLKYFF
jgi:hypothetical protein